MILTEFELTDTNKNKYYGSLDMESNGLSLGVLRIGIFFDPEKKAGISEADFQEKFSEKDTRQQIGRAIYKWLHTCATAKNERNFS